MEIDSSPAMSTKLLKKKKNHAVITITLEVCGKWYSLYWFIDCILQINPYHFVHARSDYFRGKQCFNTLPIEKPSLLLYYP